MRSRTWAFLALLLSATVAFAQDAPKPEQLKKMYDDALAQLKAAQDRKTELAQENEQLKAQLAEVSKERDRLRNEMVDLKRQDADLAERTFFLRSQYAAWQTFLAGHPEFKARWELFLDNALVNPHASLPEIIDPQWPMARGNGE
jgi:predicted nuclease with TOPRIM domain